jgi:hypothetical protein
LIDLKYFVPNLDRSCYYVSTYPLFRVLRSYNHYAAAVLRSLRRSIEKGNDKNTRSPLGMALSLFPKSYVNYVTKPIDIGFKYVILYEVAA